MSSEKGLDPKYFTPEMIAGLEANGYVCEWVVKQGLVAPAPTETVFFPEKLGPEIECELCGRPIYSACMLRVYYDVVLDTCDACYEQTGGRLAPKKKIKLHRNWFNRKRYDRMRAYLMGDNDGRR
jgi:hypothetical protein